MIGICWARSICLCSSCEQSLRIGGLRFIYLFHKWEDDFELPPFNSTRMVLVDCCQLMRQSGCATAIGFVGIVFVIPDRNFDLWFSVMCLQNLHKLLQLTDLHGTLVRLLLRSVTIQKRLPVDCFISENNKVWQDFCHSRHGSASLEVCHLSHR